MLTYRSRFLTRGEVWFDDEPDETPVDWLYYRQRPSPDTSARWRDFHTLLIDLSNPPEQLLAEMDPKTVQKIEQAEGRDLTRWEKCDALKPESLDEIERIWNEAADTRKTRRLDRPWLEQLRKAGRLELSATKDVQGNVLTYQVAYVGKRRIQNLIAVAPAHQRPTAATRNRINRANCLGHWKTMLDWKARGLRHFDFGGWYPGKTDMRFLGMNAFKKSFGGKVVREFDGEEIRTLKGWILLTVARALEHARLGAQAVQRSLCRSTTGAHAKTETGNDRKISPAF